MDERWAIAVAVFAVFVFMMDAIARVHRRVNQIHAMVEQVLDALRDTTGLPIVLVGALVFAGCGGSSPTSPGPAPSSTVSLSGRITTTLTDAPVAGATVTIAGRTTGTAVDGTWQIDGLARNATLDAEVSAPGYLTRNTRVKTDNGRADVAIDLIRDAAPFNLAFYRQFARNAYAAPESFASEPLRRWTTNPSIYFRSVPTGANTTALESIARAIVSQGSGGALSVGVVTFGTEALSAQGTITVSIVNDAAMERCGEAQVGGNTVTINTARCVCAPSPINLEVLAHEIGHALGFRHTAAGLMRGIGSGCGPAEFSAAEQYHARIAYARQPGNMDIDRDPSSSVTLLQTGPSSAPLVQCYR